MRVAMLGAAWLGATGAHTAVRACSCAIRPPQLYALELFPDAHAVFLGEAYEVIEVSDAQGVIGEARVNFMVEQAWKGVTGMRLGLTTSGDEASCGASFQVGKTYLVFAFASDVALSANLCSVKDADYAADELRAFDDREVAPLELAAGHDATFPPFIDSIDGAVNDQVPRPPTLCGIGAMMTLWLGTTKCLASYLRRR